MTHANCPVRQTLRRENERRERILETTVKMSADICSLHVATPRIYLDENTNISDFSHVDSLNYRVVRRAVVVFLVYIEQWPSCWSMQ